MVERLLAVQAQDSRGFRLAIRARTAKTVAADVDRALSRDRSLVVSWLNRGTLHLVTAADYWWLHPLTTPQLLVGNRRRLGQEQVGDDEASRGVAVLERGLAAEGPLTRSQIRELLRTAGIRVAGQALIHILFRAALDGLVVRGPMVGGEQAYVLVHDWLGPAPAPVDRDVALAELARRYLAGHAPATDRDLAKWAQLPLGEARRGLAGIARSLVDRGDGLVALRSSPQAAGLPPPRLLGSYDPVLLGWVDRRPVLGDQSHLVTSNGLFRPFAMVAGRAAAGWSLVRGRVELAPFRPLRRTERAALDRDGRDVVRFLGLAG